MKVLMLNGSPHAQGNTARALAEMERVFEKAGIEVENIQIGGKKITGCTGCGACSKTGACVIDDLVNEVLAPKLKGVDGMVVGTPVYYAGPNGDVLNALSRLFYSTHFDKTMKVGTSIAIARRGGQIATCDMLNKYFGISGMPVATSSYWNMVFGARPGEAEADEEGMQTMRDLANNMVFLMKSIALGKETFGLPVKEPKIATNMIR